MIEPLRLNIVHAEPATAKTPVFCENCKSKLETRRNPNLAVKWCPHCLHRKFLCKRCDEEVHRLKPLKLHVRHLLVVGPGVRKKVLHKGDGTHFPRPLDMVSVRVRTDAYQEGNRVLREPAKEAYFYTGLSGDCVHVQILGAKRVLPASHYYRTPTSTELEPTASPFISASYAGRDIGDTKIRSHTVSPKWANETVIVPVEDGAALRALVRRFEEMQQMEHFHPFGADAKVPPPPPSTPRDPYFLLLLSIVWPPPTPAALLTITSHSSTPTSAGAAARTRTRRRKAPAAPWGARTRPLQRPTRPAEICRPRGPRGLPKGCLSRRSSQRRSQSRRRCSGCRRRSAVKKTHCAWR